MNTLNPIRKALFLGTLAASTGFGIGCVLVAGGGGISKDCGDIGTNSSIQGEECVCDSGYEFCTSDPNDFECCPPENSCPDDNSFYSGGLCYCDTGYGWCNPSDPDDLSCCVGGDTDGTSGKETATATGGTSETDSAGTTGGTEECPMSYPPNPADCDATTEGTFYCTNVEADGPRCSTFYVCTGGAWVEANADGDANCQFDGYDFAYGCVFSETEGAVFVCGKGPGTDCTKSEAGGSCLDADNINYCHLDKLTEDSCQSICNEIGEGNGVTYDVGECVADGMSADCVCCDLGEPGCDGGTSTSG